MPKGYQAVGTNVKMQVKGDELTIKVDLSKKGKTSQSGKSKVIASLPGRTFYLADFDLPKFGIAFNLFKVKKLRESSTKREEHSESSE